MTARPDDHYDPAQQKGVDWALVPIILIPFLVVCGVIAALLWL